MFCHALLEVSRGGVGGVGSLLAAELFCFRRCFLGRTTVKAVVLLVLRWFVFDDRLFVFFVGSEKCGGACDR